MFVQSLSSSVTYTFSVACNGSSIISGNLPESAMLQYRSSDDWNHWIPTDSSKPQIVIVTLYCTYGCLALFQEAAEAEIALNDNITDLQLRWVQNSSTEGSVAWLIDEIFVTCPPFSATITFEETDRLESFIEYKFIITTCLYRTFHNFWECSSGYVETGNSACLDIPTESHLLMNGTEREARTRLFTINSQAPLSSSSNDAVSSCRGIILYQENAFISIAIRMSFGDHFLTRLASIICRYSA